MNWSSIGKLAQDAFRVAVNEWIGKARIQGGQVRGPAAILTPGSLVSETDIQMRMLQILGTSEVPRETATAVAEILAAAWKEWAAGFQMQIPTAFPTFAAFPGPAAPPTPAVNPHALSQGSSAGEVSLKAPVLANRLSAALRTHASKATEGSPDEAIKSLATWVDSSFTEWKALVKLVGLTGKGQVATFAPPYVPVGPVTSGETISIGTLFAGPRFGRVL